MRPTPSSAFELSKTFQFTHPGRGATSSLPRSPRLKRSFNSRTPGGVRRSVDSVPSKRTEFQFTHPGRGATIPFPVRFVKPSVSIHAPREGCDMPCSREAVAAARFNSRTPGGVRPPSSSVAISNRPFQFTHPGRGATSPIAEIDHSPPSFNSRTPGGVRRYRSITDTTWSLFQFTHPGRGATAYI